MTGFSSLATAIRQEQAQGTLESVLMTPISVPGPTLVKISLSAALSTPHLRTTSALRMTRTAAGDGVLPHCLTGSTRLSIIK